MKRVLIVSLVAGVLFLAMPRLPAPISEEAAPTPKPQSKQPAPLRLKSKPETPAKPKAASNKSFVGSWTGLTTIQTSSGETGTAAYLIKVSDDEKTVWINWGESATNLGEPGFQAPCNRFGEALTWSLTFPESMVTDTLRMIGNGTAAFSREGRWTSGDNQGITYHHTGTLSRQDKSLVPSTVQATPSPTPGTRPTTIPTASPVPNRPGFVYDPFDPKSRMLLDVRGRTPGTKVKDPAGRLFIVP